MLDNSRTAANTSMVLELGYIGIDYTRLDLGCGKPGTCGGSSPAAWLLKEENPCCFSPFWRLLTSGARIAEPTLLGDSCGRDDLA